jgi:hypothetical protein
LLLHLAADYHKIYAIAIGYCSFAILGVKHMKCTDECTVHKQKKIVEKLTCARQKLATLSWLALFWAIDVYFYQAQLLAN